MVAERTEWKEAPVIGQRASYTTTASWGTATGSGIYLGVALDEEGGVPYHYLVDGEVNGLAQSSHGFPAAPGTPTTTDLTPTALVRFHGSTLVGGVVLTLDGKAHGFRQNAEGDVLCPKCGHHDVALWADDGEANEADWWQCETFSGGCGAQGAVCPADDTAHTQNGLAAEAPAPVTINIDGRDVTLTEARQLLRIPPDYCVGCWLGDASPKTHDYAYGCELGGGGE